MSLVLDYLNHRWASGRVPCPRMGPPANLCPKPYFTALIITGHHSRHTVEEGLPEDDGSWTLGCGRRMRCGSGAVPAAVEGHLERPNGSVSRRRLGILQRRDVQFYLNVDYRSAADLIDSDRSMI